VSGLPSRLASSGSKMTSTRGKPRRQQVHAPCWSDIQNDLAARARAIAAPSRRSITSACRCCPRGKRNSRRDCAVRPIRRWRLRASIRRSRCASCRRVWTRKSYSRRHRPPELVLIKSLRPFQIHQPRWCPRQKTRRGKKWCGRQPA
jgi:hypothetical protein